MRYQFDANELNFQNQITRDFFSTPKKVSPKGGHSRHPTHSSTEISKLLYFFKNSPIKYLSELTINKADSPKSRALVKLNVKTLKNSQKLSKALKSSQKLLKALKSSQKLSNGSKP